MKILVIEDNETHVKAAMYFFVAEAPKITGMETEVFQLDSKADIHYALHQHNYDDDRLNLFVATNYEEAEKLTSFVDGIISDIYFPLRKKGPHDYGKFLQPEPIGVRVAVQAEKKGIPFVLNSSGWNHGEKYQWIFEMAGENGWTATINSNPENQEAEATTKNWEGAFTLLREKMG